MVCVWPFGLVELWLGYSALQNLIPSFPCIVRPPWRNPRKGREQILPSGNLAQVWTLGTWTLDTWAFDAELLSREELAFAKSYREASIYDVQAEGGV